MERLSAESGLCLNQSKIWLLKRFEYMPIMFQNFTACIVGLIRAELLGRRLGLV